MFSYKNRSLFVLLIALIVLCEQCNAYLPGLAKTYKANQNYTIQVNKITSVHTQIPYEYYKLPVCQPDKKDYESENLGEILLGDVIESSLFREQPCTVINGYQDTKCEPILTADQTKTLQDRIKQGYRAHWLFDGLPARQSELEAHQPGFDIGFVGRDGQEGIFVNNHFKIVIHYHQAPGADDYNVVGFVVEPSSVEYTGASPKGYEKDLNCPASTDGSQIVDKDSFILWTYSVTFQKSETRWEKRWDTYLKPNEQSVRFHWFSILNSLMIVFFLTVMVALIMMRTLKADFRKYNSIDASDEPEETGWKMIHGDVFRPPTHPMILSVLVGSGVQVFAMTIITMLFAILGFLSPANIGSLQTSLVVLFVIMAMFAGYFSTRAYVSFKGTNWKRNTINTAFGFPGFIFFIFFIINMMLRGYGSSAAIPFTTFLSLIAMWFGISVPLAFTGSYFAFKKPVPQDPVRTNQIPRQIPDQIWYMKPALSILMGAILPFGAVFIELYFILSAVWDNQLYYIFGFLFIVLIILVVTSAEITIVMCYFQLCAEDYHWWWRSFLTSGASALFMFLYFIYFFKHLQITKFVSIMLYFGYSLIMASTFFVMTGAIGFYACHWFVRKIYSSIHIN
ncbi:TM9 protein A [Heterostelium album PN500]|uniref:Transmembrane 9 superfamily member n=1 Tax=Heterostelium pallidum (strain ATCC 26659 / Pp 5 / PN500) TaxID=670386 RepID=D3BRA7_HETP5|nr:TM9 protein A [Heterostelium album PN500]EFA75939.1 TM9 protein A [Heterostelium album PN500]|eukprot:XP_020428073.1 TM9 protein A [Heterostelium album PN500]